MPNHFHLMVRLKDSPYSQSESGENTNNDHISISERSYMVSNTIAIILRSYTRAINKQENRTGSLFRGGTKALCLTSSDTIEKNWSFNNGITEINTTSTEIQYPQICYRYILNNPVAANMVNKREDWPYSSARDVMGLRNGNLIDRKIIEKYGLKY